MAKKYTAGLLLYRIRGGEAEVFLVHPGGPYWTNKDAGAWSIPKGEAEDGEDLQEAARREFHEETGSPFMGPLSPLVPVRQRGGKIVHAWAGQGDLDAETLRSNFFTLEWPPRSGRMQDFPEVDRAGWFTLSDAEAKMLASQRPLLGQLKSLLESARARGRDDDPAR